MLKYFLESLYMYYQKLQINFNSFLSCYIRLLRCTQRTQGRSAATYLTTWRTPLTWKERLFVVVCWLPKGTIQVCHEEYWYSSCSKRKLCSPGYASSFAITLVRAIKTVSVYMSIIFSLYIS